jgi:predicted RNA methylase
LVLAFVPYYTTARVTKQGYSTPVPIAYLAGQLAGINKETTVYEPTAGNGALLLLADPQKAVVNELNPNRVAALRAQGFTVTSEDASTFLPAVESVDRIITNPPFGSLKDAQGLTQTFRRGLLTTSQLDHAIALTALDLMKPKGRAVLILGGKMGDEQSRTERYNTQLTRGFYRWLYKDAGYKVADHFSISGSLYRKQGTSFPIDVIVIGGIGETQLKLPGVEPPRRYESYEALNEVLIHAVQQQHNHEPNRDSGTTLRKVYSGSALDTNLSHESQRRPSFNLDNGVSTDAIEPNREPRGVFFPVEQASGVVNSPSNPRLVEQLRTERGARTAGLGSAGDISLFADVPEHFVSSTNSEADGFLPGDELPGTTTAMYSSGRAISSNSTPNSRTESELSGRHEFNRLVGMDEHGHESTQLSGLNPMDEPTQTASVNLDTPEEESLSNQVPYNPRSKAFSLSTLAPAASLKGLENAFNKIEATTGLSIDEYVCTRLNERSLEELFNHYAAEQIDSLALSIFNHEFESKATLIGHDTGIGKTRIVCGLARYAQQQGLSPVIVTADPVLYADILARDGVDTGNSFNPLITNNGMKLLLTAGDGKPIGEINTPNRANAS